MWRGVFGVSLFVATFIGQQAIELSRHPAAKLSLGHDLLPSYTAGVLVRAGRYRDLYDSPRFQRAERSVIDQANLAGDERYAPWLNPPFFAWAFAPLAAIPYRQALVAWAILNLALAAASAALLCRALPGGVGWRTRALVPACLIVSVPFWQAASHQQNTFLSLFLLTATAALWRSVPRPRATAQRFAERFESASRRSPPGSSMRLASYEAQEPGRPRARWARGLLTGATAGFLLFKPQLAAVVIAVLVADIGLPALIGAACTAIALLLVNELSMPGSGRAFLHGVPPIVHFMQMECDYNWGRQMTFHAFWRLLVQGRHPGNTGVAAKDLWWASALMTAAGLARAVWRQRATTRGGDDATWRRGAIN